VLFPDILTLPRFQTPVDNYNTWLRAARSSTDSAVLFKLCGCYKVDMLQQWWGILG
jgi:hypothetical protein